MPVASGDRRGAALNLLFLPLMIACFPLAVLLGRARLSRGRMLGAVLVFSALSGLAMTALLRAMDAFPAPTSPSPAPSPWSWRRSRSPPRGCSGRSARPGSASPRCCSSSSATRAPATPRRRSCSRLLARHGPAVRRARAGRRSATPRTSTATRSPPALVLTAWALFGATLVLVGRWAPKRRAGAGPSCEWRCRHDPEPPSGTVPRFSRISATRGRRPARRSGSARPACRARRHGGPHPVPAHRLGRASPPGPPGPPAPR